MNNIVYCRKNGPHGWFLANVRDWRAYSAEMRRNATNNIREFKYALYVRKGSDTLTIRLSYWSTELEAITDAEALGFIVMPVPEGDAKDVLNDMR